jgi:DNA-binding response OmpR family regulator
MSTEPKRVLVVEDEPTIAASVAARLEAEGYDARVAGDGHAALSVAAEHRPDLVVLDLMLPGLDGLEVCRRLQAQWPVPVLMLTARDDETDVLVGLGVGADDYLTKPFSMRELVARVHALLRRVERAAECSAPDAADHGEAVGEVRISRAERRVWRGESEIHLTPSEFTLLVYLVDRPRTVCTREQLLTELWGWADAGTRTVDSHVKALRRKLGAELIRTVHGIGYALETR